jgi:uncharacterized protein YjiS (DUF1127 family)
MTKRRCRNDDDPLSLGAARRRAATTPTWRLGSLVRLWRTWFKRTRQRRDLAELSDTQLRDVGLSREAIKREVEKPFWMA